MAPGVGKRAWPRKLVVGVLALVASLALAEIVVRLAYGAPRVERLPLMLMEANESCGWRMVPNQVHYTYQHEVRVNSLGLRGPELGPKRADEVRVLALGDSLVYGQGVAETETLPSQLERALAARDPERRSWTVVNAGHRAYDTYQELQLLAELAPAIQPDVVVLFWYWNDLHERDVARTYANLKGKGALVFDTGDRLEGWDGVRWRLKQLVRRSALVMFVHDALGHSRDPALGPGYADKRFAKLAGYLERFAADAPVLGHDPVFALIPDPNLLAGREETRALGARATALAVERGLPVIDLAPALEPLVRETGELPVIPFDGHYLPEANGAMAELVAERLLALGLPRARGQ